MGDFKPSAANGAEKIASEAGRPPLPTARSRSRRPRSQGRCPRPVCRGRPCGELAIRV
ncbi:MAG: hypothetical protein ACLTSX_05845 [Collinsella sp.]